MRCRLLINFPSVYKHTINFARLFCYWALIRTRTGKIRARGNPCPYSVTLREWANHRTRYSEARETTACRVIFRSFFAPVTSTLLHCHWAYAHGTSHVTSHVARISVLLYNCICLLRIYWITPRGIGAHRLALGPVWWRQEREKSEPSRRGDDWTNHSCRKQTLALSRRAEVGTNLVPLRSLFWIEDSEKKAAVAASSLVRVLGGAG